MSKFKHLLAIVALGISSAWAQTVVPIVWPFNPGSTQSNYIRAIVEDANTKQNKYQFVFEHRPGAGGSIAMNHTLAGPGIRIVSNSSSLFLRPLFYPNESYDISRFTPVLTQMTGQPIAVTSKKYSSINELKQQSKLSIGIINGSVTQLVAETLAKQLPKVDIVFVPYQGTLDITRDVVAGHLDLGVEFAADLQPWIADKKINIIGITGKKSHPGFATFTSQGYPVFENIVQNYFFLVPADMPEAQRQELHEIFRSANRNSKVVDLYLRDFAIPADHDFKQTNQLYQSLATYWRTQVNK